ncbi:MAG: carbon-nitrogen hydrolase family protein [Candidatus Hodarchaeota archaeon]
MLVLLLIRVAAIQMLIGGDLEANLERARKHISTAVMQGAEFVCLPEYFSYSPNLSSFKDLIEGYKKTRTMLKKQSARNKICLVGGSVLRPVNSKIYNSTLVFNSGRHIATADKLHPTRGEKENGIRPGSKKTIFKAKGIICGILICADILFPQHLWSLRKNGIQLLFVPLVSPVRSIDYTQKRRDTLFISRAFDLNAYVIKTGSIGIAPGERSVVGRSLIASPADILIKAKSEEQEEILIANLEIESLKNMDLLASMFDFADTKLS